MAMQNAFLTQNSINLVFAVCSIPFACQWPKKKQNKLVYTDRSGEAPWACHKLAAACCNLSSHRFPVAATWQSDTLPWRHCSCSIPLSSQTTWWTAVALPLDGHCPSCKEIIKLNPDCSICGEVSGEAVPARSLCAASGISQADMLLITGCMCWHSDPRSEHLYACS